MFCAHFQHGCILKFDDNSALFLKFEKSLPITGLDLCYAMNGCLATGLSMNGGQTITVNFLFTVPEDLEISVTENDVELCADGCGITWDAGNVVQFYQKTNPKFY